MKRKKIPMPPIEEDETLDAYTDRLTGADKKGGAYKERRSRSCCIGYHEECTDHGEEWCKCPCHPWGVKTLRNWKP